jgi:acetyl-CoA carboxylase biotin carboxyl carrier protein
MPNDVGEAVVDDSGRTPSPFDVRTIKYLVGLMSQHDLNEIDLREGDLRIRLRRGSDVATLPATNPAAALSQPTLPGPPEPAARHEPAKAARELLPIKSPTVGTFYSAPSPDAEPFVRVGSKVTATTIVCVIEAMKIFNEIPAEHSGVIAEILVENQQPVEFGQVLFRVDPAS